MTRSELFGELVIMLENASDTVSLDAARLIEFRLGISAGEMIAYGDLSVDPPVAMQVLALAERRACGEPLAYICGEAWFYGRPFFVDPRVLVPRPETEELLEAALDYLRLIAAKRPARALDIGTGSGAIALSLAAELPSLDVSAIDISPDALAVARMNLRRHDLEARVRLLESDLLSQLEGSERFDLIAANLPYVPTAVLPEMPNPVAFEPRLALDGGSSGIEIYRRLFAQVRTYLKPSALLLLEAAPPTMGSLVTLAEQSFAGSEITTKRDYGGAERILRIAFSS